MITPEQISDNELLDFLTWYYDHYQETESRVDLMAISAAGHFHMTQKTAAPLVRRAVTLGFLERTGKDTVIMASGTAKRKKR